MKPPSPPRSVHEIVDDHLVKTWRERESETAWHLPDQRNRENARLCHCGMHIFSSTSDDKSVKVMGDQNVDCNQGIKQTWLKIIFSDLDH